MSALNYKLIVPPTVEPVSLSLAKKQVRIDIPDDDDLLEFYIGVAREHCEDETNRSFYTQQWQLSLDSFPYGDYRTTIPVDQRSPWNYSAYWNDLAIRLPKPTTLSVQAINYIDGNFNPQTMPTDSYYVDLNSEPSRITPVEGFTWPITQFYQPGSIQVQYTAGSFVSTITSENVTVTGTASPYIGVLKNQVISITSVVDQNGAALAYTDTPVLDSNGDPTNKTQLSFTTAPLNNIAIVTYQAGMIPKKIAHAMLLIIGHLYEHREENTEVSLKTLPLGVANFLQKWKFDVFGNYRSGY